MVELFREPKIDWIGAKKYFIGITIALLLLGALAVQIRGFNAGVDFTGGTMMTVRFKQQPSLDTIRGALANIGIDTSKVTLQPVTTRQNEIIIRAPQLVAGTESERRVDEDKRTIIRALQQIGASSAQSATLTANINTVDVEAVEAELRQADPLGVSGQPFAAQAYLQIAQQVISFRDQQKFIRDASALNGLPINPPVLPEPAQGQINFDAEKVKQVVLSRFSAGPIDINLAGTKEVEDLLNRIDPMATGTGSYGAVSQAISKFRKDGEGVVADLSQLPGLAPEMIQAISPYFIAGDFAVISADVVGAVVGSDLRNRAIYVTLAALAGMLIYLAFRFEWIYGVAAVVAVFHDVLITLGVFSLFQWEISLTVIASLLTLIGYSMNDTIVIFDRIRENLRLRRRDNLVQLSNDSINQTLSRTVITQGLTFMSVVAIVLFGGEVLRGFALALTIGIIVGTYSSIAVATPIMLWWEYMTNKRRRGKIAEAKSRASERTLARV
jgi:preprotein translocase subunit SecF